MIIKTSVNLSVDIDIPLELDEKFYFKGREYIFEECYVEESGEGMLEIEIEASDSETGECADFTSEELKPYLEIDVDFEKIKFCLQPNYDLDYITKD